MEVQFNDARYDRLEIDPNYTFGLPVSVVTHYRMSLQLLRAAVDEKDLRALHQLNLTPVADVSPSCNSVSLGDGYEILLNLYTGTANRHIQIIKIRNSNPAEDTK
jgi:plasmid maintenance system killer protein